MPAPASHLRLPARRDPVVAAVARRWRELTSAPRPSGRLGPGESTLIACSGGADSSALVLALAAVTKKIVVAHVIHDLRPTPDALADRDAVRAIAESLGLIIVEASVSTRDLLINGAAAPANLVRRTGDRNAEALARRLRYLALAQLARQHNLRFIATAHHAGDQLESILMALVRGAGPRGLRGTATSRTLRHADAPPGAPVRLIRPMLGVTREDCERLCRDAGWTWREDLTNADTTRLRSYLRHRVIPQLRAARPGVDRRAAAAAELLRDAAGLISDRAKSLLAGAVQADKAPGTLSWPRHTLRNERHAVLGELIRRAAIRLAGAHGVDRLGRSTLDTIISAITSQASHPRDFPLRTIEVRITSKAVTIRRRQNLRS